LPFILYSVHECNVAHFTAAKQVSECYIGPTAIIILLSQRHVVSPLASDCCTSGRNITHHLLPAAAPYGTSWRPKQRRQIVNRTRDSGVSETYRSDRKLGHPRCVILGRSATRLLRFSVSTCRSDVTAAAGAAAAVVDAVGFSASATVPRARYHAPQQAYDGPRNLFIVARRAAAPPYVACIRPPCVRAALLRVDRTYSSACHSLCLQK